MSVFSPLRCDRRSKVRQCLPFLSRNLLNFRCICCFFFTGGSSIMLCHMRVTQHDSIPACAWENRTVGNKTYGLYHRDFSVKGLFSAVSSHLSVMAELVRCLAEHHDSAMLGKTWDRKFEPPSLVSLGGGGQPSRRRYGNEVPFPGGVHPAC